MLQVAKTVESTVQTETLSNQLLQNVGKLNQTKIHGFNKQQKHGPRGPNPNVTTVIAKAIPGQIVKVVDVVTMVLNQNCFWHTEKNVTGATRKNISQSFVEAVNPLMAAA